MKFNLVAEVFNEIEQEPGRLAMTKLLADLFKKATPSGAAMIAYLSLGDLNPTYIGTKFNFADKSMQKVLSHLLKISIPTVSKKTKQYGDAGLVIEKSDWKPRIKDHLTVTQVNKFLHDFLKITGTGSQEAKESALLKLLKKLDPLSAKYVVRVVLQKLRLGFSDMTLLDAFSWMQVGDKSLRKQLEDAYNTCADIGLIIKVLKEEGIKKIEKMEIEPGVPIRPAAAERMASAAAIVKKIGKCVAQPKLDGFRLQVHVFKNKVRFFSRNLQDMSEMFPELSREVKKLKSKNFVAEGEAIAYDVETGTFLPFQETVKRRRKYDIEEMAKDVPLKLYLFDLLYISGKSILDKTHMQRRKLLLSLFKGKRKLEEAIVAPLDEKEIKTTKELEKYFSKNISDGLEGLVVKKIDSIYQPGKRNFNWIKLKREETGHLKDTIDCVILGYYAGHGKRASFGIGALLVGVYNKKEDRFETVAKIGTGLSDKEWREQKKMCDKIAVKTKPKNVVCAKELVPDVWVAPEIVCLIRADEITVSPTHSATFALRFPRIMGYRDDKSAKEATTVKEIERLYKIQFKGARKKRKKKSKKVAGQREIF
jgi:DNA ligase-1